MRLSTYIRTALQNLGWHNANQHNANQHNANQHNAVPVSDPDIDALHPELSRSIRAALASGMSQAELAAKLREVAS